MTAERKPETENERDRYTRIRDRQKAEWGAVAPGWERNRERMSGPASTITERLVAASGVRVGDRVLDLACGVGDPAFTLAEAVGPAGYVLGLDLSPEMVEAASSWAVRQGIGNAEFRAIRSELDLGIPVESFDVATCRLGLQFMPDPVAALQEVRATLKPGGRLAVSVWGAPERNPNFTVPMGIIRRHAPLPPEPAGSPGIFALSEPDDLEVILNTAGFNEVRTEVFSTPVAQAKDPGSFWYGVSTIAGPLVARLAALPEEQRREIREDAVEILSKMFPEGPVEFAGEAVVASGVKTL